MKEHTASSIFSLLGISEQAEDCYLCLLDLKTARAREIAEQTGIHRTIVYKPLEELLRVGLVSELEVSGVKTYVPTHPQMIQTLVDDRTRSAQAALPSLLKQYSETAQSRVPKLRFHADLEGIRSVMEEILINKEKYYRVMGAFHDEAFLQALGENYLENWTERRITMNVHHQTLRAPLHARHRTFHPKTYKQDVRYLREVRFIDLPDDIPMLTYLYDKKVAFISGRIGSFFATVIESEDLYKTMNAMFEVMWRAANQER